MRRVRAILPLAAAMCTAGCSVTGPTYAWQGPEAALRQLHENAAAIRSVQSSSRVILERPNGDAVRLDAVLLAEIPDRLRVRAWKLGQAVFDLTYTPDGLWFATGDNDGAQNLSLPAAGFARAWSLFAPDFFESPFASVEPGDAGPTFTVLRRTDPGEAGGTVRCEVERSTLRPLIYTAMDESGSTTATLKLEHYRSFSGTFWPSRISAASDHGTVTVVIESAHFNEPLPPGAFIPPARAARQP